ncbi:MAG: HAD family hydrolase [Planctomycetes bacterium]|nr:HAD family hydrolase [Planctomycetota bacterium]
MPIRAVIFDLDGTITQPFLDFHAIREEMGLDRNGGPILEAMETMTAPQRRRAEAILSVHEEKAVAESTLNVGARETLATLRERRLPIGILTRNRKDNAWAVARKHDLHFDAVVGREDGPVKPDSFGVLHLCRGFAVAPAEAMLVGDYLFDLLCARAAGAIPVLLANHDRAGEFARHADFTIARLLELLPIIDHQNHSSGCRCQIQEKRCTE